jgi:hypothetical protein
MTPPEIKQNQPEIKGRGGRRPGAGRPRKGVVEVETAGRMALMREVEGLREEVKQLKKRLAEANSRMALAALPQSVGANDEAGARYQMPDCIHGGVFGACRKLGCRPK